MAAAWPGARAGAVSSPPPHSSLPGFPRVALRFSLWREGTASCPRDLRGEEARCPRPGPWRRAARSPGPRLNFWNWVFPYPSKIWATPDSQSFLKPTIT